jgi:ABC-type glycerol-3-phosphate transport system substrate-binding protein
MSTLPNIQPYTVEQIDSTQEIQPYYSYDEEVVEASPRSNSRPFIIILIIFAVFVILAIILLISGLRPTTNQTNQNTDRQAFIQWWGAFLPSEVVQPLIDEYKTIAPNVTIEYANKMPIGINRNSSISQYKQELDRVLSTGNAVEVPDIYTVNNTWVGDYESFAEPSTVYDINSVAQQFYPAVTRDFTDLISVYGIPLWIDNFAIIYNKDLLATVQASEPPTQWPLFQNLAKSLTVRRNNVIDQAGFAAGTSTNSSFSFELFNTILAQNGVAITDEQNNFTLSQFGNEFVQAFSFFKSFASGANATWADALGVDTVSFLEGRTAMLYVPSWRLREILRINETFELGIDIGISSVPQVAGQEKEFYNWTEYWGLMVAKGRSYSRESWDFLFWLTQPEQLKKISANVKASQGYFGSLYPRSDMSNELANDEYLKIYNESLNFSDSWRMIKGQDVRIEFKEIIDLSSASESLVQTLQNSLASLRAIKGLIGE